MKTLLITLSTILLIALLIVAGRVENNVSIETYNTKDIKSIYLHYGEMNDGNTLYSDKLTDFWFCKDNNFKHFDFKVKKSTNLYGTTKLTYIHK